jgi:hypothetical protein
MAGKWSSGLWNVACKIFIFTVKLREIPLSRSGSTVVRDGGAECGYQSAIG